MIIACPSCFTRYKIPETSLGAAGRRVKCKNCGHTWQQAPEQATNGQNTNQQATNQQATNQQGTNEQGPPQPSTPQAAPQANHNHNPEPQPGQWGAYQTTPPHNAPWPDYSHDSSHNHWQAPPAAPMPPYQNTGNTMAGVPALYTAGGKKILPLWVGIAIGAGLTLTLFGAGILLKDPLQRAMPAMASLMRPPDPTESLKTQQPNTQGLVVENIERDILEEGGFTTYVIAGNVSNTNMKQARVPNLQVSLLDEHSKLIDQWTVQPDAAELAPGESTNWTCYFYNPPLARVSEYQVEFVK